MGYIFKQLVRKQKMMVFENEHEFEYNDEDEILYDKDICYIKESINEGYTRIVLGHYFNGNVDNLPHGITHLYFGNKFNKPIDFLPNSITHLTLGEDFQQKMDNLPNSITHISMKSYNYKCDYENFSPDINFSYVRAINQKINKLPKNLDKLIIGCRDSSHDNNCDITHPNLKILKIKCVCNCTGFLSDSDRGIDYSCQIMHSRKHNKFVVYCKHRDAQYTEISCPNENCTIYVNALTEEDREERYEDDEYRLDDEFEYSDDDFDDDDLK